MARFVIAICTGSTAPTGGKARSTMPTSRSPLPVSQATVSRYMPARSRRPTQSWRNFLRNQTIAFGQYSEERSNGYARPYVASYLADLMQFPAAQIAKDQQQPTPNAEKS